MAHARTRRAHTRALAAAAAAAPSVRFAGAAVRPVSRQSIGGSNRAAGRQHYVFRRGYVRRTVAVIANIGLAVQCRAVPCRAVPCRAVPCGTGRKRRWTSASAARATRRASSTSRSCSSCPRASRAFAALAIAHCTVQPCTIPPAAGERNPLAAAAAQWLRTRCDGFGFDSTGIE